MGGNKMIEIQKKRIIIFIGIFFAFILIISVIYLVVNKPNSTTGDPTIITTYTDPGSGETVYTTPNKTPESAGPSATITYLGFSKLLNIGMTFDQLTLLKSYFAAYSTDQKTPIKEISITVASLKQIINRDTGEVTVTFNITIDRNSVYNATIKYSSITTLSLTINNPSDNIIIYQSK